MAKTTPTRNCLLEDVAQTFRDGLALIEKKNQDYGAVADPFGNFTSVKLLGLTVEKGILVRVLDKLVRANNLLDHEAFVTDESMEDTLLDAINYLAILKAYRKIVHQPDGPVLHTAGVFEALQCGTLIGKTAQGSPAR